MKWRLLVAVALAACSLGAQAVVTQLFSENEMATSYLIDFESGQPYVGSITFSGQISSSSAAGGVTPSPSNGLGRTVVTMVGASLSGSYTAVGMYFGGDYLPGIVVTLSASASGTSVGSVTVDANSNSFADQFIGLASDVPFDAVFIKTYSGVNWNSYIDDFRVGAPVPEPQTYALMLAGLAALGLAVRRREA